MNCLPQPSARDQSGTSAPSTAQTEAVLLRPATLADADALALVGAATFLEAFTWMLPGADIVAHCAKHHTVSAYRNYLQQSGTKITLAQAASGGAPVGYAMLTTPELPSFHVQVGDVELKRLYLFSRFRSLATPVMRMEPDGALTQVPGLKAGQALMEAAITGARDMKCTRLLLGTHAGNHQAISFYRKNGFQEGGTRTFQVGSQVCCDLIFVKTL